MHFKLQPRIQSRPLLKDCAPNIISPNQDGKNDKFEIRFAELFSPISLKIYNRWGKQLENIDNYKQDFEGKNLPSGAYFIEVVTPKDSTLQQWLQVIR